ncbi:hypothetical protein KR50_16620 [Jeotgalibacillus campisalis]|uniref:Uncharacterized protein n=1 Tax=Jeotgalibacillus campisalis TaxID=220754 RepID=A0A0C2RB06_9BACL|nr:hypothetical protein KR50_16620 [Jeotgalibacillus campisalis]
MSRALFHFDFYYRFDIWKDYFKIEQVVKQYGIEGKSHKPKSPLGFKQT